MSNIKTYSSGSAFTNGGKTFLMAFMLPFEIFGYVILEYSLPSWTLYVYCALLAFINLFILASENKLKVNIDTKEYSSIISFAGINLGRKRSFQEYNFLVFKRVRLANNLKRSNAFKAGNAASQHSLSFWAIDVWNPVTKDSYQIYHGTKQNAISLAMELKQFFPELKIFKGHIKRGNEFDFTKLKRKAKTN